MFQGRLHLSQCFVRAGQSGDTGDGIIPGFCVNGGPGLMIFPNGAQPSLATQLGSTILGGQPGAYITQPCTSGGQVGPSVEGDLRTMQGNPRAIIVEGTVPAGAPVTTTYRGQPGDLAVRLVSDASAWKWRPLRKGALLVDNSFPALIQIQGTLDGGGTLEVIETFGLPANMQASTHYLQGLFVNGSSGTTLTNPRAMTILDPSL